MRDISKRLTVINTEKKDNASDSKGQSSGVTYVGFGGGGVRNLNEYLLKSIWDRVWEIRTDSQGTEYIFGKLPVVTQYGITMYSGENMDIPTIAEGLPFDNRTIWFNPTTGQIEVIGGTGGGATTLGSLINVGSWADSVANQDRIMYQAANSSQWVAKNLSDLAVGGITGDYLPLSGGTINGSGDYLYVPLYINALNNQISGITFKTNGTERGHVGYSSGLGIRLHSSTAAGIAVSDSDEPIFYTADGSIKNTIWHEGNDGSGSGLDADLLDGLHAYISGNNGGVWGYIPSVKSDGVIELGRYIDFHFQSGENIDYSTRLYVDAANKNNVALPSSSGTLALLTDNVASATKLQTSRTIWGQSFDGTGNVSGDIYTSSHSLLGTYGGAFLYAGIRNGEALSIETLDSNGVWLNRGITLLKNGNVGIGTPNPSDKLHIVGDVNITKPSTLNQASLSFMNTSSDLWQISGRFNKNNSAENDRLNFYYYNGTTWSTIMSLYNNGNMLVSGGITMYSDQRKKTILNHVQLSLQQVANAPLIEHYYNSDEKKTTHVGSIAQYWAGLNDWFCKLDNEGYYTMEIQNAALASAISVARELVKFETETDRRIRLLEEENKRLKEEVEQLKWNIA